MKKLKQVLLTIAALVIVLLFGMLILPKIVFYVLLALIANTIFTLSTLKIWR